MPAPPSPEPEFQQTLEQEAERSAELNSPEAAQQQSDSVDAFASLPPSEATELFLATFESELAHATSDPAEPLREADEVLAYPRDNIAVVDPAGPDDRALHVSSIPLRTQDGELPELDLSRQGNEVTSAEPLTDVTLPDELSDGAELGKVGVTVGVEGAAPTDPDSRLISTSGPGSDKEAAFYPEVVTDTDVALAPRPRGIETFAQLRSEASPEALTLQVGLPAGGRIEGSGGGEAVISDGSGKPLASVQAPVAIDAQGTSVPIEMEVQGHDLVLRIPHRGAGYAYPILVDPVVEYWYWLEGSGISAFWDGSWTRVSNWGPLEVSEYCNGYLAYSCNGTGWGLHVRAMSNGYGWYYYDPGSIGYWAYAAPGTTSYITDAFVYYLYYYRGGSDTTDPYAFAGLANHAGWIDVWTAVWDWWFRRDFSAYGNTPRFFYAGLYSSARAWPSWPWRYLRIADMGMFLNDPEAPTIAEPVLSSTAAPDEEGETVPGESAGTVPPNTWFKGGPEGRVKVDVKATDPGLGVKSFKLTVPQQSAPPKTVVAANDAWCYGSFAYGKCPTSRTDRFTFNSPGSPMPEGVNTVTSTAVDTLGKSTERTFQVRVDRTRPDLAISDAWSGEEPAGYSLSVTAADPGASGQVAGIKSVDVYLNGTLVDENDQSCEASCPSHVGASWTHEFEGMPAGDHQIRVVSEDLAGNVAESEFDLPGQVVHARLYSGNPVQGGVELTEEWAQLGTQNSRIEHVTDGIVTRGSAPCPADPNARCGQIRRLRPPSGGLPPLPTDYSETTADSPSDEDLPQPATLLAAGEPAAGEPEWGETVGTGQVDSILESWQVPPPEAGTTYELRQSATPAHGELPATTQKYWLDARTALPLRSEKQIGGGTPTTVYYSYSENAVHASSLGSSFFHVQAPSLPDECVANGELGPYRFNQAGMVVPGDPAWNAAVGTADGPVIIEPVAQAAEGSSGRATLTTEGVTLHDEPGDIGELRWNVVLEPLQQMSEQGNEIVVENGVGEPVAVVTAEQGDLALHPGGPPSNEEMPDDQIGLTVTGSSEVTIESTDEVASGSGVLPCVTEEMMDAAEVAYTEYLQEQPPPPPTPPAPDLQLRDSYISESEQSYFASGVMPITPGKDCEARQTVPVRSVSDEIWLTKIYQVTSRVRFRCRASAFAVEMFINYFLERLRDDGTWKRYDEHSVRRGEPRDELTVTQNFPKLVAPNCAPTEFPYTWRGRGWFTVVHMNPRGIVVITGDRGGSLGAVNCR